MNAAEFSSTNVYTTALEIVRINGIMDISVLHKLLYLLQKECICRTGKPFFVEKMYAWLYTPSSPEIYSLHKGLKTISFSEFQKVPQISKHKVRASLTNQQYTILYKTLDMYARHKNTALAQMVHQDYAYIKARENVNRDGYADTEKNVLTMSNIQKGLKLEGRNCIPPIQK